MIEVRRWPRWLRSTLLRDHASRDVFSIERVLGEDDRVDVSETWTCCDHLVAGEAVDMAQKMRAATELNECLGRVPTTSSGILLSEGVDDTGMVYIGERIVLTPLGPLPRRTVEVTRRYPMPPASLRTSTPSPSPAKTPQSKTIPFLTTTSPSDESPATVSPTVNAPETVAALEAAAEAETVAALEASAEAETVAALEPSFLSTATPPSATPQMVRMDTPEWLRSPPPVQMNNVETTVLVHEERLAMTLVGRITPPLLAALAAQRASIPVVDGSAQKSVMVFRQGNGIRIGSYLVHPRSYDAGKYVGEAVVERSRRGKVRNVVQMHRKRRNEFERR